MKPVLLIGNGLRYAPHIVEQLCKLDVPVLLTWQAADLLPEDDCSFCGRPGGAGQRAANIILQKSNWVMVAGARLDQETVGHNLEGFARNCKMPVVVDCDVAELRKFPEGWGRIMMDFNAPKPGYGQNGLPFVRGDSQWLTWCKALYNRFRPELDGSDNKTAGSNVDNEFVDPYSFIRELSDVADPDDILVPGSSGMQSAAFFQAFKVKRGQRILCANTMGAMGFEPMAIGAAIASDRHVIVVTGDGGFSQNFQELEVVKRMNLPIHFFVFSNGGYGSIATMQDNRFHLRVGATPDSGFTVPDLEKIADVFDMPFYQMRNNSDLNRMGWIMTETHNAIISVRSSLEFRFACRTQSAMVNNVLIANRLEDMSPKLPDGELERLMNEEI